MVLTKFGRTSLRLFHLILEHKHVEQKQVNKLALIGTFKVPYYHTLAPHPRTTP